MNSINEVSQTSTQCCGVFVALIAPLGIFLNIRNVRRLLKLNDWSSFHILCMSKILASIITLSALFLNHSVKSILYIQSDSTFIIYLEHALGTGIYCLGPAIQTLTSINRFYIVWSYQVRTPRYSTQITVASLLILWSAAFYFSTLIGFSRSCLKRFYMTVLKWLGYQEDCEPSAKLIMDVALSHFLLFLGVFSNILNAFLAIKLFVMSRAKSLSSETARNRRKSNIRMFVINCVQDWIYLTYRVMSLIIMLTVQDPIAQYLLVIGLALIVPTADGPV